MIPTIAITALLAFEVDTHRAVSEATVMYHRGCEVNDFLRHRLLIPRGIFESLGSVSSEGNTPVELLGSGSVDEDSHFVFRYDNHFYNPITKEGLTDPVFLNPASFFTVSSLDWAWNNAGAVASGDFSWTKAREHYLDWLTAQDEEDRREAMAETFYTLGHVIHLVQDLAQPQHTRNDAHAPRGFPTFGDSAPFEEYCNDRYNTAISVAAFASHPLPKPKSPDPRFCGGKPPEFVAFWDSYQLARDYQDVTNPFLLDPNTLGLAEFSNAFFVTDDTLFTGEPEVRLFADPQRSRSILILTPTSRVPRHHRFPWPKLGYTRGLETMDALFSAPDGEVFLLRYGEGGGGHLPADEFFTRSTPLSSLHANIPRIASARYEPSLPGLLVGLTTEDREALAKALLPKAISYSAALLNYFFRGRLSIDVQTAGQGARITIKNDSIETLHEGSFTVYNDDREGRRSALITIDAQNGYPGGLPAGTAFTVSIPAVPGPGPFTVVFEGRVGNESERGIAVGALCGAPSPLKDPASKFLLTDLGSVDNTSFRNDLGNWSLTDDGEVLGFHRPLSGSGLDGLRDGGGFVWKDTDGDWQVDQTELRYIGGENGDPGSRIMDLNDRGMVAGIVFLPDFGINLARWSGSTAPEIGPGGLGGLVIDNDGNIFDPILATLWSISGVSIDLRERFKSDPLSGGESFTTIVDMNDLGEFLLVFDGTFHVWRPGAALLPTGVTAVSIGILNNSGQAALIARNSALLPVSDVVWWDRHSNLSISLGTPADGLDMNDCGLIVLHRSAPNSPGVPFIWHRSTGLKPLNDLVEKPSNLVLTHALRTNNRGQVLALGLAGDQLRAFLLTPPELRSP